jgi:hypothetical protein
MRLTLVVKPLVALRASSHREMGLAEMMTLQPAISYITS